MAALDRVATVARAHFGHGGHRGGGHGAFHNAGLDVEILKLLLKLLHQLAQLMGTNTVRAVVKATGEKGQATARVRRGGAGPLYLHEVHGLHCSLHAFDDAFHGHADLTHGDGGLDAGHDGIHPSGHAQELGVLATLVDHVFGMDSGVLRIAFLQCLHHQRGGMCGSVVLPICGCDALTFLTLVRPLFSSFSHLAAMRCSCLTASCADHTAGQGSDSAPP